MKAIGKAKVSTGSGCSKVPEPNKPIGKPRKSSGFCRFRDTRKYKNLMNHRESKGKADIMQVWDTQKCTNPYNTIGMNPIRN